MVETEADVQPLIQSAMIIHGLDKFDIDNFCSIRRHHILSLSLSFSSTRPVNVHPASSILILEPIQRIKTDHKVV